PLHANPRAMSPMPAAGLRAPAPEPLVSPPPSRAADPQREIPREPSLREKIGFLARLRRSPAPEPEPEPELIEPDPVAYWDPSMPQDERIKARISDVIRSRVRRGAETFAPPLGRIEPPLVRPQMPQAPAAGLRPVPATAPLPVIEPVPTWEEADDSLSDLDDTHVLARGDVWEDEAGDLDAADDDLDLSRYQAGTSDRRALVQHSVKKAQPSRQALSESQPALRFDEPAASYELPPLSLLAAP
ncbi:MAG TPA: hypothetical protein PKA03_17240, partial [Tabrizicola sp.]|nr:hypothetical protein [Tabrizicola sp.]